MIGGLFIGFIVLLFAAYTAKVRRQYKDSRKELIRGKHSAVNDNDGSKTPLQSNDEGEM